MKVNLKKIGAIVAGAAMLAVTPVVAGLVFQGTTLVNDNGQPVAKVVVGSGAQPSDAVAAGMIAAKLASEAHKMQTLTASLSGTAVCGSGVSGNGSSSGKCSVVQGSESATLEIVIPGGSISGQWTGNNLIADYVDRTLLDRKIHNSSQANTDTDSAYPYTGTDTNDNSHPFSDGKGGTLGQSDTFLYKIGSSFSPFADQTITDSESGKTFTQKQSMWIGASNYYVTDSEIKNVVGDLKDLFYYIKFDGPASATVGIPVCSEVVSGASSGDYTACKNAAISGYDYNKATEAHRVKVWFLGEQWIISEMNPPTSTSVNLTSESQRVAGGSVKLAKESAYGTIKVGQTLDVGDGYKVRLNGVQAHGENQVFAIVSLLDSNGQVVKDETVQRNGRVDFLVNGKTIRIRAYKVTADLVARESWAQLAVYANELEIKDDTELNQAKGNNKGYKTTVVWSNLEASNSVHNADALRSIVIYADDLNLLTGKQPDRLLPGDGINVVLDPKLWKLSYKGLDISQSDRVRLSFSLQTSNKDFSSVQISGNSRKCRLYGPYVKVESGASDSVFESPASTNGAGTLNDKVFFVGLNGNETHIDDTTINQTTAAVCDDNGDGTFNSTDTVKLNPGVVFMKVSNGGTDYGYVSYSNASIGTKIKYTKIADGSGDFAPTAGGVILIQDAATVYNRLSVSATDGGLTDLLGTAGYKATGSWAGGYNESTTTKAQWLFAVAEKAGEATSSGYVDYMITGVTGTARASAGDATFDPSGDIKDGSNNVVLSSDEKILYGIPVGESTYYNSTKVGPIYNGNKVNTYETGLITGRGSKFSSRSSSEVVLYMAHTLAHPQWFLQSLGTSNGTITGEQFTLKEGESKDFSSGIGKITVKLNRVDEEITPCTLSGGSAACTVDMSPVKALINGQPSVAAAMPYSGPEVTSMVILDKDAPSVGTLVSVGGDKVNSLTAKWLQNSKNDWNANKVLVKEVVQGSAIIVAGAEAKDTLTAADQFVNGLKRVS